MPVQPLVVRTPRIGCWLFFIAFAYPLCSSRIEHRWSLQLAHPAEVAEGGPEEVVYVVVGEMFEEREGSRERMG